MKALHNIGMIQPGDFIAWDGEDGASNAEGFSVNNGDVFLVEKIESPNLFMKGVDTGVTGLGMWGWRFATPPEIAKWRLENE